MAAKKKQSKIDPTAPRSKTPKQPMNLPGKSGGKKPALSKREKSGLALAKSLEGNPVSRLVKEVKQTPGNIVKTGKSWAGTAARQAIPGAALVNVSKKGVSIKSKKEIVSNLKKDAGNLASMYGTAASSGRGASYAKNNTYTFGKTVVHGSPKKGLKQITPRTGSNAIPDFKVAYGYNAKRPPVETASTTRMYAQKQMSSGSYYVGKIKRSSIVKPGDKDYAISPTYGSKNPNFIVTREPIKKLKEIPGTSKNVPREIAKKSPGATIGRKVEPLQRKVKREIAKRKYKKTPHWNDNPEIIA